MQVKDIAANNGVDCPCGAEATYICRCGCPCCGEDPCAFSCGQAVIPIWQAEEEMPNVENRYPER